MSSRRITFSSLSGIIGFEPIAFSTIEPNFAGWAVSKTTPIAFFLEITSSAQSGRFGVRPGFV